MDFGTTVEVFHMKCVCEFFTIVEYAYGNPQTIGIMLEKQGEICDIFIQNSDSLIKDGAISCKQ